jgi:hypothetical protein
MFKIASTLTAFAALAAVSVVSIPAHAAVKIAASVELELPDFMPELKKTTLFVLDQRAEWPVAATKEPARLSSIEAPSSWVKSPAEIRAHLEAAELAAKAELTF